MSETPAKKTTPAKKAATRKTTTKKSAPAKKTTARKTTAKKAAPAKKTAAKKTTAKKAAAKRTTPTRTAPPSPKPVATAARRSPAGRVVDAGAQALSTAAIVQKVAQDTAERVAAETAARVSKQYETAIAELTRTLDRNTKRALKSVRAAADLAQSASPVKRRKKN